MAYAATGNRGMPSDEQEVIALLIEEAGRIKVFVDPEWLNVVGSADRQYIDDILSGFAPGPMGPGAKTTQTQQLSNMLTKNESAKNSGHYPGTKLLAVLCKEKADAQPESAIPLEISNAYDGRGGGIRTPDPLLPKQMRYQTALRPDNHFRL